MPPVRILVPLLFPLAILASACTVTPYDDDDATSILPADLDGDGYRGGQDCDDTNPAVYPGADPICEVEDADCDGTADTPPDLDGDGYAPCPADDSPPDCDDNDPAVNPGTDEVCDGVDNNCNNDIDEGFDVDQDGVTVCAEPLPDCDDTNPAVYPGAREVCDGLDNDCDSKTDETLDNDGDGFTECSSPEPDCDDTDPAVAPGLEELCDGLDNDCDGEVDETFDADADGYTPCMDPPDCDDSRPDVHPGAVEVCDSGADEDCDGVSSTTGDQDGDGYDDCAGDPLDCDDSDPNTYPGAPEACDFLDNDCDERIDEDLPGDANEPNDSPDEATDLGTINGQETTIHGALSEATDQDWFTFYSMDEDDDLWLIRVTLNDIPDGGNYDLFLFGEDDLEEPLATSVHPGNEPEEITFDGDDGTEGAEEHSYSGRYYIQVLWSEGVFGCPEYTLTVYAG